MFVNHSWESMRAESWKSLNRTNQRDAVLSRTKAFGNCFLGLPFARCWTWVSVLLCEVRRVFCIATCAGCVKVDGVCLVVFFSCLERFEPVKLNCLLVLSEGSRVIPGKKRQRRVGTVPRQLNTQVAWERRGRAGTSLSDRRYHQHTLLNPLPSWIARLSAHGSGGVAWTGNSGSSFRDEAEKLPFCLAGTALGIRRWEFGERRSCK